jgi:RHS repeat-associated protein
VIATITRFGYAGEYTDPSGLIYLRARYYDTVTAQFLSVDPIVVATRSSYAYTHGDPIQDSDPMGLLTRRLHAAQRMAHPEPSPSPGPSPTPESGSQDRECAAPTGDSDGWFHRNFLDWHGIQNWSGDVASWSADVALASAACSGVATVAGAEPLALGCGFATKVFGYTAVAATGINMVAASQNGDWETVAQDATALLAGGVTRQALGVGGWRLDEAGRRGADLLDQVVATLTDWTFK